MNESTFEGGAGLKIFTRSWQPEGETRGVVVIIHGLNSHSGQYLWVGEQFAANDLAAYALDLRGPSAHLLHDVLGVYFEAARGSFQRLRLHAVADAVGVRILDLPITAEKIYRALREKTAPSPSGEDKKTI